MPKIKLTYFDFPKSRGEECRLALHLAGVEFEDARVALSDWPTLKESTPFGGLPILEVEGKGALTQSNAILMYIGREHGLHPTDPWEAARHEQLMCAAEDLRHKVFAVFAIQDENENIKARKELASGPLQVWGRSIEPLLGDGPFVAGDQVGVADIKLYTIVHWFASGGVDHVPTDVLGAFPRLTGLYQAFKDHPAVRSWYAS